MKAIPTALLALVAIVALAAVAAGAYRAMRPGAPVQVELDLYSGRPNPSWTLTADQTTTLDTMLAALSPSSAQPPEGGLGYRGFLVHDGTKTIRVFQGSVTVQGAAQSEVFQDGSRALEHWLLETGQKAIDAQTYSTIQATLH
jgi:hypothetical protein